MKVWTIHGWKVAWIDEVNMEEMVGWMDYGQMSEQMEINIHFLLYLQANKPIVILQIVQIAYVFKLDFFKVHAQRRELPTAFEDAPFALFIVY